jgi:Ser/Thr protein kinase RdoA (MazF antagonist)
MCAARTKIAELIPNILKSWNIVPDDVSLISTNGNCHWKVLRGSDAFVLRMYRRGQSNSAIRYELDILDHLRNRGWPVAPAVDDTVLASGVVFALFPFLAGRPRKDETPEQMRCRGRILAELHCDLNTIAGIGQRTGWQRADQLPQSIATRSLRFSDLPRTIALHLEGVQCRLDAALASSLPVTVIHGDFIAQNLLFQKEKLSGVLDFDSVHLDLRAADVACARRSGHDDVVRGYLEISPLTDAELGCLDDLWRASVLRYSLQVLGSNVGAIRDSELQWCAKQLKKTIPFDGNAA